MPCFVKTRVAAVLSVSPRVEVSGRVADEAGRLAGVTGSVMPRFFLGDPTAADWVSEPGVNNGGLRWLQRKLIELGVSSVHVVPALPAAGTVLLALVLAALSRRRATQGEQPRS